MDECKPVRAGADADAFGAAAPRLLFLFLVFCSLFLQFGPQAHAAAGVLVGRGLHSSTFQLTASAFCGIGGTLGGVYKGVTRCHGGGQGCFRCDFVSETAQVELRSG